MTENNNKKPDLDVSAPPDASQAKQPVDKQDNEQKKNKKRTWGLWAFDAMLYPFLTNFGVFAISVVATYLTGHGDKVGKEGSAIRSVGAWFQRRGEWMTSKFQKTGMSPGQADMMKMVFFSFADGSAMAPLVKLLEDRREKIAHALDKWHGSEPEDKSVYEAEPKQSWWSVLGGRFATAAIVVPTAVLLDKTGLNDKLFHTPGLKTGERIAKNPNLAKWFGKLHIPYLFKTIYFEAFYTSVCTAGLYFSSRFLASLSGKHKKAEHKHEQRERESRVKEGLDKSPSLAQEQSTQKEKEPGKAESLEAEGALLPYKPKQETFAGIASRRERSNDRLPYGQRKEKSSSRFRQESEQVEAKQR